MTSPVFQAISRPDVRGKLNQINNQVPLAQQNPHQPTGATIITRTNVQNQNILQPSQTGKQHLSQQNLHQNVTVVKARSDVKSTEQSTVNSSGDRQPIKAVPHQQVKSEPVVVPTPQNNSRRTSDLPSVFVPPTYDAPQQQYKRPEVVVPTPQDSRSTDAYYYHNNNNNNDISEASRRYAARRPQGNPPSLFSFFMTVFVVVALAIVILAMSDKRRW